MEWEVELSVISIAVIFPLPALLCSVDVKGWLRSICVFIYSFTYFYFLFLQRLTSALFIYDKRTLLDIGQTAALTCFRTFIHGSSVAIGDSSERRVLTKATRIIPEGERNTADDVLESVTDWETKLTAPPLPSILLANVQSLENKMDDLRARTSFQRDIRDCNILCLLMALSLGPGHRCNSVW